MKKNSALYIYCIYFCFFSTLIVACNNTSDKVTSCTKEDSRLLDTLTIPKNNHSKESPESKTPAKHQYSLKDDQIILARVNGEKITQYDLDQNISSMFSKENIDKIGSEECEKIVESLIRSKAISQAYENEMTPEQKAVLEKEVNAYREQLMVKKYLVQHTVPQPVTEKMIQSYYDNHPEEFSGKKIYTYEMIASQEKVSIRKRDKMLTIFKKAADKNDWQAWTKELQTKDIAVFYRKADVTDALHSKLKEIVSSLSIDGDAHLTFLQNKMYLLRVINIKHLAQKPLEEVEVQIRKMLVPVQIKKSIQKVMNQILSNAAIERIKH